MLKVGLLCGVIAAMSATGVKGSVLSKLDSKPVDAKFIIELNDDIDSISADEAIKQQDAVYRKIRNSINANAIQDRHFTLLNNAVVVSANKEDIGAIRKIPGVKYVTENGTHIVEKKSGSYVSLDLKNRSELDSVEENASATTMKKPSGTNEGEGTVIAVLDNEFYLRGKHAASGEDDGSAYFHETYTALPSGTKQRLEFSDIRGATELNARKHAGTSYVSTRGNEGSFYLNTKVPFYYDYAGDTYTGGSYGAKPDFNVESTVDLHGSHVSSIAAGNAETYKGIAPKAQLALMKVFTDIHKTDASEAAKMGEYGRFNEVAFIEALEDCIKLGVDAINVSIGSDLADFEEGTISQRTLQKITDAGILSSISAGNAGKMSYGFTGGYANWTKDMVETGIMGSFANNASTMTIAAGQPTKTYYENSLDLGGAVVPYDDQIVNREGQAADYPDNEHRLVELINGGIVDLDDPGFEPTAEQQEIEIEYVYLKGFGEEKDYKNLDVANKIVVVNRGKINFSTKYENAENHGAKALIIINNDPTEQDFNFRCDFGDAAKSIKFPVVVALFKDKPQFEANPTGTFKIKRKTSTENVLARTISDFSTDGATYDLDLKPEITAPGSNIKGAVWPQNKAEKKTPYAAYEYFNGTSMSAPNYEGAMAVVLSKVAKNGTDAQIAAERKLLDMKMMSTADPMKDSEENDENHQKSVTSPRMQGAGMADIEGAYNTSVYLEGKDSDGTALKKAKILLRNNDDIASGKVKLSFIAHNDSQAAHTYKVSYSVMRPAIAWSNKVLSKDYHAPVEVDSVKSIPGWEYFSPEEDEVVKADGTASYKDVIKVSKDITYYRTKAEYADGQGEPGGVIKEGLYYVSSQIENSSQGIVWSEVPKSEYQSIKDIEIAKVDCGNIVIPAGTSEHTLPEYVLTQAQKDEIARLYESGTYVEGYVTLESQDGQPDLSMPYMGFYSLADRKSGSSYESAPVVEPFSFEKDPTKFYGSDLVNDVAKSLLGKDSADMGSMMVAGYAKNIKDIDTEGVLTNDFSFNGLKGFYEVGTVPNPYGSSEISNPGDNIYIGNPSKSNTLIIQQFVYRSVADNFFTITNKATGKEVYRSALEDCLYGATAGKYALYKSHVEGSYLGGGYVAHRAWGLVPLYDQRTREAFASGDYELKFNYLVAGTGTWVSKSYTLHIDSDSPEVEAIIEYTKGKKDTPLVRITYSDARVAYAVVGNTQVDVRYDEASGKYISEFDKSIMDAAVSSSRKTSYSDSRAFIKVVDYARGETTAIVHFGSSYCDFTIAQGTAFTVNTDFKFENGQVSFIEVDESNQEHAFTPEGKVLVSVGKANAKTPIKAKSKSFLVRFVEFLRKIVLAIVSIFVGH